MEFSHLFMSTSQLSSFMYLVGKNTILRCSDRKYGKCHLKNISYWHLLLNRKCRQLDICLLIILAFSAVFKSCFTLKSLTYILITLSILYKCLFVFKSIFIFYTIEIIFCQSGFECALFFERVLQSAYSKPR